MTESPSENELIQRLLQDRDAEYRRANKAERELKELSNVAELKQKYEQKLSEKDNTIAEKDRTIAQTNELLKKREDRITELEKKLLYLERKMWGAMSEKRKIPDDPNQLKLDFGGSDFTPEEETELRDIVEEVKEFRTIKVKAHEKKIPVRQHLPETLRRVENHIYPDGYLGHEDEWILFDETETSEHLELQPAEFYVRVTIRHKGMRKDTKVISVAPVPLEPIAKSYASASLLTDIIVGKYVDHLPFHRQIQIYKRLGVTIPAATIESWFHEVADLMRPLYYRLRDIVLSSDYVQSDETTVPIVNNEKHKTVKGYLWLVRDVIKQLVFFHYDEGSRGQKVALSLFRKYKGCIQTDGYAGYNLLEKIEGIITIACWAHCRRYFERSLNNDKARAEYALAQIGMLYTIETMADDENATPERRQEIRTRLAFPVIRAFEKWCLTEQVKVLPKSPIGRAINYFLNFARQLSRYTMDGRYRIDSNLIENSVRPVAVGRRNYLFCGNHDAAEDAAVIYSLMGCCKAADVDFKKWMNYFLSHVHEYDNDYTMDLEELLPNTLKSKGLL
jgi:transposase/uncharacterized coiled-coil protein SlyX